MPDTSPRLALPYLMPSQAQKHVTHNEALRLIDTLVQLSVEALDAITPPALPTSGAVWALGDAPTGDWAGQDQTLALWDEGAWQFTPLQDGWCAVLRSAGTLHLRTGGAWSMLAASDLDNLAGVGIGTMSDGTNRLAVASDASLFSHDGTGHQIKINKNTAADTASMLFQTAWSGRAEMGLTGSDDFAFKVSPDGSGWTTALDINANTGEVTLDTLAVSGQLDVGGDLHVSSFSGGSLGSLVPGSSIGALIEGRPNGHLALGIRGNNAADSVNIVSGGGDFDTDSTYDTLVATFQASGNVGIARSSPKRVLHVGDAMRIDPSPEPANPAAGDLYFDNTTNKLRCHDGTIWHDLF